MFEAIVGQVKLIHSLGGEAFVFAARDEFSEEDSRRLAPAKVHYAESLGPKPLAYAPGLLAAMEDAQLDCLHLHGIWQGSSLTALRWSKRHPGRTIVSPHGMLDPWITGRGRLKKIPFWWMVERGNLRSAAVLHALTKDEAKDILRWVSRAQVRVIRNPVAIAEPRQSELPSPIILYLGRLHEKKNIAALIEAWNAARPDLPRYSRLRIAGWGDEAIAESIRQAVGESDRSIEFLGAVYGAQKSYVLENARFLVLGSHSEGLPMVLLEAWEKGLPTIQTEFCNLPEGYAAGAAILCQTDARSIADALVEALNMGEGEWNEMSRVARMLAQGPFSRKSIARHWGKLYAKVMQETPDG
ncbi:glycosyltransferase [Altererythrobacter sp. MF3-039]|uniref:glycosyltransferase n=1 Tax=Altererythrobacter sp. MF3-039 TaxID=3252901 RepID=UPI00390CC95B